MGMILLLALSGAISVVLLVLCGRVVERRLERKVARLSEDVDELRILFVLRWEGLERSVNEGLAIAAKEAETARDPDVERRLIEHSIELLSHRDAAVWQIGKGRGFAIAAKAGKC